MGQAHDHTRFPAVEFIPFAHDITAAVKAFASQNNLLCECFYHDLPVWIIHEPERLRERVRRVQVMAYLVSQQPYLSFVPTVDLILSATRVLVPKKCPPKSMPTSHVLNEQTFDADSFCGHLADVWRETETLEFVRKDMVEVAIADLS